MNSKINKHKLFIIINAVDAFLSGLVLLVYLGFFPIDISGWGIPRWFIGLFSGLWFLSAVAVLVYQVTRTDTLE